MRRIWAVARRDYLAVVRTRGFLLSLVVTPVFLIGILLLPVILQSRPSSRVRQVELYDGTKKITPVLRRQLEAISRRKGLRFQLVPVKGRDLSAEKFFAQRARELEKSRKRYALVWLGPESLGAYRRPPAKRSKKERIFVRIRSEDITKIRYLRNALRQSVTAVRLQQLGSLGEKVQAIRRDLPHLVTLHNPEGEQLRASQFLQRFMTGIIFILLLYMSIQITGNNLVTSVVEEKSSRIMEVLLSSITPTQLMMGKVLGLGAAGLTMICVFASVGYLGAHLAAFPLQLTNLAMFVLYYLLAFLLYSVLLAGLGSICTTEKEAQQLVAPVMMMLILPAIFNSQIVENPGGTFSLFLSLFPFTAPGAMLSRMGVMQVPPQQIILGVLLLLLSAAITFWISVQIFRVGVLMYGKRPSFREVARWLVAKG